MKGYGIKLAMGATLLAGLWLTTPAHLERLAQQGLRRDAKNCAELRIAIFDDPFP